MIFDQSHATFFVVATKDEVFLALSAFLICLYSKTNGDNKISVFQIWKLKHIFHPKRVGSVKMQSLITAKLFVLMPVILSYLNPFINVCNGTMNTGLFKKVSVIKYQRTKDKEEKYQNPSCLILSLWIWDNVRENNLLAKHYTGHSIALVCKTS